MKNLLHILSTGLLIITTVFAGKPAADPAMSAQEQKAIVDLRGQWKFEIGDDEKYADPKFNDSKWEDIFVPDVWEDEGYPGYDGFGWYRKHFTMPATSHAKNLNFNGGFIDDVCAIYINGHLIGGKGKFPPGYETAYDQEEIFPIPETYLKMNGDNVVAIRVYDGYNYGGITRGKIGIYYQEDELNFAQRLPALWKFQTGDDEEWSSVSYNDSKWNTIVVPSDWEYQGYARYDGFAWYRVTFSVPSSLQNEKLFLILGKIDDVDETYFNGTRIGNTGHIGGYRWRENIQDEYQQIRAYRIPAALVKFDQQNLIAVRVYDHMGYGGIWEGPIGIVGEREYKEMYRNIQNQKRIEQRGKTTLQKILEEIFNDRN
jgi:hypothetical protein